MEIEERIDGQVVRKIKAKHDETMRNLLVMVNAEEEAWEILKKTELCMKGLFDLDESQYWRDLVWGGVGGVSPKSAPA